MPKVPKMSTTGQPPVTTTRTQVTIPLDDGTAMLAMIQALIPLGLRAVEAALQAEVTALAGRRYAHADGRAGVVRWGTQAGSIYLADQKLALAVPRVRDRRQGREVALPTYRALQTPRRQDVAVRHATASSDAWTMGAAAPER